MENGPGDGGGDERDDPIGKRQLGIIGGVEHAFYISHPDGHGGAGVQHEGGARTDLRISAEHEGEIPEPEMSLGELIVRPRPRDLEHGDGLHRVPGDAGGEEDAEAAAV